MADLTDLTSAQSVKIIGADSAGIEQTPVKSSENGDLGVSDISNAGGVQGAITVGTSAIEVKVGGSALANRKFLSLHNNSNATWYWGFTNAVTTSTGTPLFKDQFAAWAVGPNTSVWVIAGSAGNNGRVTEAA